MSESDLCFTLELAEELAFANPFVMERTFMEEKVIDHFGQTKKRNPRFVEIDHIQGITEILKIIIGRIRCILNPFSRLFLFATNCVSANYPFCYRLTESIV